MYIILPKYQIKTDITKLVHDSSQSIYIASINHHLHPHNSDYQFKERGRPPPVKEFVELVNYSHPNSKRRRGVRYKVQNSCMLKRLVSSLHIWHIFLGTVGGAEKSQQAEVVIQGSIYESKKSFCFRVGVPINQFNCR